jgi:hypothetical protein
MSFMRLGRHDLGCISYARIIARLIDNRYVELDA